MRVSTRTPARRRTTSTLLAASAIAASLVIAACGGSGNSRGSGSTGSTPSPSGNSVATVATKKVAGYGTVLATGRGAPLYVLSSDPRDGSSCTGSCAKTWPPLTVTGKPTAGSGVDASKLSSFKRSDGSEQVSYNGQALYTHPGLSATSVAGTASDGGVWYLISPSGSPIKKAGGGGY